VNQKPINPARIIGIFLVVFAACVLLAIPVSPTVAGKLTNLICGAVIGLIGGGFLIASRTDKAEH